jgi:hypothetical protein
VKWLLKALLEAIIEVFKEWKLERDYQDALKENERRDTEAKELASQAATRKRMRDVPEMASDDPGALREWLRARPSDTK